MTSRVNSQIEQRVETGYQAYHSLINSRARCIASYGAGQSRHRPCPRTAPASGLLLDRDDFGEADRLAFLGDEDGTGDEEDAARLTMLADLSDGSKAWMGRRSMESGKKQKYEKQCKP